MIKKVMCQRAMRKPAMKSARKALDDALRCILLVMYEVSHQQLQQQQMVLQQQLPHHHRHSQHRRHRQ